MIAVRIVLILVSISVSCNAQLLCFGAKWCEPCREMQPVLDRLEQEGYALRKLDVDARPELARRYSVSAVPSFILVDGNGEVVDRIDQATSLETLSRMLAHHGVKPAATITRGQSPAAAIDEQLQPVETSPLLQRPARANLEPQPPQSTETGAELQQIAMAATLRLRVEDEVGHSFGTGTVVDVHGQEALVLTCGHIFRESQGKGAILIDRFDSPTAQPTSGSVISYDIDLDVALVSMKLTRPIQIAKLAPLGYKAKQDDVIFSVGCSRGHPPTVIDGKVNQVDKYLGPPNITASGRPVDGRSGGGLFNREGLLIGVCSAADPEIDEGIYAALPRVYYELDRNGLSFVYEEANPETGLASTELEATGGTLPTATVALPPQRTATIAPVSHEAPLPTVEAKMSADELVCVLRGDGADRRAFVIQNPSKVLLEYLAREAEKGR